MLLDEDDKEKEIYRYEAEWLISSLAWSNHEPFLLALNSFINEYSNRVDLVKLSKNSYNEQLTKVTSFEHPYPATKILFIPGSFTADNQSSNQPQLLASTADYLRIWRLQDKKKLFNNESTYINSDTSTSSPQVSDGLEVKLELLLNTNQGSKQCAPLTSFDWNELDPSIIITSSVDACCAVWDLEVNKLKNLVQLNNSNSSSTITSSSSSSSHDVSLAGNLRSQIMTHNQEVYDVSFSRLGGGRDVFATAGGDGTLRLFDLRRLTTSSILFQCDRGLRDSKALVRVACNKLDTNLISTFSADSKNIILIDNRRPTIPLATLSSHVDDVNSMSWSPNSAHHLCSGSKDQQALIWDLNKLPLEEPLLAYRADGKINATSWSNQHTDWIGIGFKNFLEILRK